VSNQENNQNPYQAPQASLEQDVSHNMLAPLGSRFVAALLDGLLLLAIYLPVMYFTGYFDGVTADNWEPSLAQEITAAIFGLALFFLVNGYLLKNYGQTVGKWMMGIGIRDMQGNLCDFVPMVLKREILWQLIAYIPAVGIFIVLVDILFIFRADRRCMHDLLAETQVLAIKKARN